MFRIRCLAVCALTALLPILARSADPLPVLDVWPKTAPGEKGDIGEEKPTPAKGRDAIVSITNVSKPTLTLYRPSKEKNTGVAVVVAPGGGYTNLAWEHEGTMVGEWLQSIGVTGVVLKYRVPRRPDSPKGEPPVGALQDAQRAISITRSRAKEWGIDPNRIGMLGFSAGGHLTAWAATNSDKRAYDTIDEADKSSCRPDFAVLIYPGGLVDRVNREQLSPEIRVSKDTPPCFFALAYNDPGPLDGSLKMMAALKKAGVTAEMHVYSAGGHGFGMRVGDKPHATWPKRCEEWMRTEGFLTAAKAASPVEPEAKLEKLASGFKFTEGPAPDAQGNVYFTDQPNDRIHIWSTDGKLSTFMEPCGRSNGLAFDKNGILWACADEKNELWKIDPKSKEKTVVVKDYNGKLLNGPNDVWVRDDGSAFFTDPYYKRPYWKRGPIEQDKQAVYFVSSDGKLSRADAGEIVQPNGIIGTPDGKTLYVADIGAGKTYQYDIEANGALKNRKLFCSQGSDGMTIDDRGNVYFTLGRAVTIYDKTGAKIATIDVPEGTTNVCFGGKDMKTLFITAGTSLYSIRMAVKGVARQ
jgi:gluconolactonase